MVAVDGSSVIPIDRQETPAQHREFAPAVSHSLTEEVTVGGHTGHFPASERQRHGGHVGHVGTAAL